MNVQPEKCFIERLLSDAVTHIVSEVDKVLVEHPNATGRNGFADGAKLMIAVNAKDRVAVAFVDVQRARFQWVVESRWHSSIVL